MNIFRFRNKLIADYRSYIESFIDIKEPRLKKFVDDQISSEFLWPKPLIQLNPSFEPGKSPDELIEANVLHPECGKVFRAAKSADSPEGKPLRFHKHQEDGNIYDKFPKR